MQCSQKSTLPVQCFPKILCRLPTHKTVVTCKAVCKHWAALLSHPFFITRFIAYKFDNHTTIYPYKNGLSKYDEVKMKMMNDRKFGLVTRMICGNTRKGLMIHFNDPVHNPNKLSLYSLPRLSNGGLPRNLTIVGSCSDLLLYCRDIYNDKLKLYISNAQTRHWLALPSLPLNNRAGPIGLICDPYYSSHTGNVTLNEAYQACIVVIPYTVKDVTEFPAHLLSPNAGGVWRSVLLSLPLRCHLLSFRGLFCIGRKLYFHCVEKLSPVGLYGNVGRLISFDPFVDNDVIKCSSLPLPLELVSSVSFFGVFHERLYMCDRDDDGRYRIWVLEDYESGQWSLRHSIMGSDWIPRDRCLAKLVNQNPLFGDAIGFHPAIPDVIYVLCDRWIVLCNLSTRKMEVVSQLPKGCKGMFPVSYSFQITLPVWPTPLPTFV
ncbi:hypothetical protein RND81_05G162400 [Saponaria officinalis]|uniref:F-box domain-containing protein n=1 Tax=Saponaria officinalis TaxID=3572 RepID=A0AAW1KXS8_SAPOF